MLPTRTVAYRDASFAELDVAAVLDRRPELALVDELAHANLPGERRAKRWHDVGELLANGIDVYTTLNVANIESLGALVSRITGVRPAEPVPDAFVRAGEIKLVDLAPAALRRRLTEGLVVPEDRVDAALSSYFRFANLAALRELTQLWLDDSTADPVTAFLAARGVSEPVPASVIVVGLEGSPPTNGSSGTPPVWPGCPPPGYRACTCGTSTTSAGHRERGWSRTAGCSASWAGIWPRSRRAISPRDWSGPHARPAPASW